MISAKRLTVLSSTIFLSVAVLSGCRTTAEEHRISSFEQKGNLPSAIENIEQWNQLDSDVKAAIIDSEYVRYKSLSISDWQDLNTVNGAAQRSLADKIQSFMGVNGATEVADESFSKVGPLRSRVRFLLLNNSLIGAYIEYLQDGCEMPDESVDSFATKEAAEGFGCQFVGASWKSRGIFNYTGSPLEYSDFMEWSH